MNRVDNDSSKGSYVFLTESGSTYTLTINEDTSKWLTRQNTHSTLRRDNEAIRVQKIIQLQVGGSAALVLEPLGKGDATTRITSKVLSIDPIAPTK